MDRGFYSMSEGDGRVITRILVLLTGGWASNLGGGEGRGELGL